MDLKVTFNPLTCTVDMFIGYVLNFMPVSRNLMQYLEKVEATDLRWVWL